MNLRLTAGAEADALKRIVGIVGSGQQFFQQPEPGPGPASGSVILHAIDAFAIRRRVERLLSGEQHLIVYTQEGVKYT